MLQEQIDLDLKKSLKSKESLRVSALRLLKTAIHNRAIEKKQDVLDDKDILDIIQKQVKQRRDSIEGFQRGNRDDLVAKEKQELEILQSYLPKQLSEAELTAIIQKVIQSLGVVNKSDVGKVMKAVMNELKGRADGKEINKIVSSLLP
ncbi:MAG: aspartyl-tRNA amidotransferase [Omnitrophica bacterium RIFCSPHIGHO2_02_FULL_49_9]|nr:MAG: aspartyl-tRNA amidotransferase [Omnitrophica bacterium RIFCSPHIGHO2_02_FULL_49_9]